MSSISYTTVKEKTKKTLTKAKIAEMINQEIGLSQKGVSSIIDDTIDEIKTSLMKQGKVKISSFGTFIVKKKKERPGNIFKTLEKVIIKTKKSISFRPSRSIKKLINSNKIDE